MLGDFDRQAEGEAIEAQGAGRVRRQMPKLERVKGIEPSYSAWKAAALPLSYTRLAADQLSRQRGGLNRHGADSAP
jgi:hypothetical protein